jgi:hypothetical protein
MATSKQLRADAVVARTPGLSVTDMDGELVMMSIENGKYYRMDRIGSRIWELVERPRAVRDIVMALLPEYEVEEGQCQADVQVFLNKMMEEGLIAIE